MPDSAQTLVDRARALVDAGDLDAALALLRAACEVAPDEPHVWLVRGEVSIEAGEHGEAVASKLQGAELLLRRGAMGEAMTVARSVLAMAPANRDARRMLRDYDPTFADPGADTAEVPVGRVTGQLALGELSLTGLLSADGTPADIPLDDERDLAVVQAMAATITSSPLLSELDSDLVRYLVDVGQLWRRRARQVVFREGDLGTSLFLVLKGEFDVERRDADTGAVQHLATLRPGAFFGEMALLADAARTATVRAATDGMLLEISRAATRLLIEHDERVLKLLMRFFRARMVGTLLATSPLFAPLAIEERRALVTQFRLRELPAGHVLLREGEIADGLYLVLVGRLVAYLSPGDGAIDTELGFLGAGDVFGEMSLIEGTPAMASIRSVTRAWVLRLPADDFARIVASHPQVLERLSDIIEQRRAQNRATVGPVRPI